MLFSNILVVSSFLSFYLLLCSIPLTNERKTFAAIGNRTLGIGSTEAVTACHPTTAIVSVTIFGEISALW